MISDIVGCHSHDWTLFLCSANVNSSLAVAKSNTLEVLSSEHDTNFMELGENERSLILVR
jgi:hypothetical protein